MKSFLSFVFWCCIIACLLSSCSNDNETMMEEDMEELSGLEGDYKGTWNSVTEKTSFTDYLVSAKLRFAPGSTTLLVGEFFALQILHLAAIVVTMMGHWL